MKKKIDMDRIKQPSAPLLSVRDLKVHFPVKKPGFFQRPGFVYAVDGISLTLDRGETLGIVGESGCGKTTTGLAMLRLIDITHGQILFNGRDYSGKGAQDCTLLRKEMQLIFQDPYSSLNPRMTVNRIIGDPMVLHGLCTKADRDETVAGLLEKVGLRPEQGNRFPHEFSGGQRQRIGIARALGLDPLLIIGDEPVSALDVSIQAQTINLLTDIQQELGLSLILISHDLAVVEYICDRIAVMYLGRIIESGSCSDIYTNPRHPYTQALMSAVPRPDPRRKSDRIILTGDVPSPIHPPKGCHFHPRCIHKKQECTQTYPGIQDLGEGHQVACFMA